MAQQSSLHICAIKEGIGFTYFQGDKNLFVYRSFSDRKYCSAKFTSGRKPQRPVDFDKAFKFVYKMAAAQNFTLIEYPCEVL